MAEFDTDEYRCLTTTRLACAAHRVREREGEGGGEGGVGGQAGRQAGRQVGRERGREGERERAREREKRERETVCHRLGKHEPRSWPP